MVFILTMRIRAVLHYSEFFLHRALYALSQYAPISLLNYLLRIRLRKILRIAVNLPFWSWRLARYPRSEWNTDFLSTVEPVSKTYFRTSELAYVDAQAPPWRYLSYSTSGSTGIPFSFYLDKREWPKKYASTLRAYGWAGRKPFDTIVKTFGSHSPFGCYWKIFPHDDPSDLKVTRFRLYEMLRREKKVILYSFPSFVLPLADFWEKDKPVVSLRSIIVGGEHLTSAARSRVEKVFGVPLYIAYACREFGIIAQECEARDGLHIFTENMLVEVINEEGGTVPPGESGEIVLTYYLNRIMPFIRYRIGDRGVILSDPCTCGRTLPRIKVEGRQTAILSLSSGKRLYLVEVQRSIINIAGDTIMEFQVYQPTLHQLSLFVVPAQSFTSRIKDRLHSMLLRLSGGTIRISVRVVSSLPQRRGVKRAFFSEVYRDQEFVT